ncbi:MAG: hypothetical protein JO057_31370 [Chloroflexi bacterium]|nr:hypothetical protein [Chloroflexota bacterium]
MTGRQRAARSGLGALLVLGVLAGGTACGANNSIEAAQTAITAAQTVLPGAQATAVAGATVVSNVVTAAQPVVVAIQGLLQGVSVTVTTSPPGADSGSVTDVAIQGTDSAGRLGQIDSQARQTAVATALIAVSQYYPKANITLTVVDDSGNTLISGSMAPGQSPLVD